jgi:hypothetical protein
MLLVEVLVETLLVMLEDKSVVQVAVHLHPLALVPEQLV